MKKINIILGTFVAAFAMTSCVGDLNVTPIDPNANTANKILVNEAALDSYISGVYLGFATSGYYGPNGDASISGLDGGASQYIRGLYHLNELTTDESVCGWNDQTIKNFHYMNWTTDDTFIYAFYSRILMQVSAANEFIREARNLDVNDAAKERYIDEARVLRDIAYFHALDNFGNVPFADENSIVGQVPEQISRADLFSWLESDLKSVIDNKSLPEGPQSNGHVGMGAAKFLLAKLYLNATVYTGTAKWNECAAVLKDLMDDGFSLHTSSKGVYPAYQELFLADNDKCSEEIIFAVQQDGLNTQSYGATNYIIFASTGGEMDVTKVGISSGWGGVRVTPEFYDKFDAKDARNLFYTSTQKKDIDDIGDFTNG
ncbi:MAG: RagB/SusD family nutrient uptake outer membrane protein, partial [Bacteroidia bacterium]|nr:RagB/SusD family nutrient uptake outer membrane protein [Bacteroidia bacterium]